MFVAPCSFVSGYQPFERKFRLLYPEEKVQMIFLLLQNVGNHLQEYMTSWLQKTAAIYLPSYQPQINYVNKFFSASKRSTEKELYLKKCGVWTKLQVFRMYREVWIHKTAIRLRQLSANLSKNVTGHLRNIRKCVP